MTTNTLGYKLFRTKPVAKHDDGQSHGAGGLKRTLGAFPLTMIGVGATIGTGIFFTMVEAVPKAGPSVILSFLLAALTAGLTALCYAELSFKIPASGSAYSFAYASLGEFAAFIVAACVLLEYGLAASAVAIGWSDYLNNFLVNSTGYEIWRELRSPMVVSGERGVELRQWRTFLALQRIQVGPARAEVAVGGDHLGDGDALAAHFRVGRCGHEADWALLGAFSERCDDGSVRDVRFVRAIDRRHMLHGVEVGAPVVWHRARVVEVGLVQLLYVGRITAEQIGVGGVFFHHLAHLSSRFARLAG